MGKQRVAHQNQNTEVLQPPAASYKWACHFTVSSGIKHASTLTAGMWGSLRWLHPKMGTLSERGPRSREHLAQT